LHRLRDGRIAVCSAFLDKEQDEEFEDLGNEDKIPFDE